MLQQRQGGFQDQAAHRSPGSRAIKWRVGRNSSHNYLDESNLIVSYFYNA